jgi:mxaA protein
MWPLDAHFQHSTLKHEIMTTLLCTSRFKHTFMMLALALGMNLAHADAPLPEVDPNVVNVQERNPERDAGYVVGDVLERTLTIQIKKPYELVNESLPIVGYEHRWRGQISGVELVNTRHEVATARDGATHTLYLAYQVFTTGRVAKPSALRAEIIKLRNTETNEIKQYRLPSFNFRVSPLSVFGQVKLKDDMSQFYPPLLLDASRQTRNIQLLAIPLVLSLLGLLYIFGRHTWLPRMGTPFAKAYRAIRKLANSEEGLKLAVERVHLALNQAAGGTLFSHNAQQLWQNTPSYVPMQHEIAAFFALSNHVFFSEGHHVADINASKQWLQEFCRHMRDCERGLIPHLPANASQEKGTA